MKRYNLFFAIVFLALSISVVRGEDIIVFVGYEEYSPIFTSLNDELDGKKIIPDGRIYKYTNGRLMKADISSPKNSVLLSVKDGVYVFYDTLDNGTVKLQFKLKGKELISEVITGLKFFENVNVAINSEYFYISTTYKGKIIRIKYRTPVKIDTLGIKGDVIYATDDCLYYTVLNTTVIEQEGYVYQMKFKNNNPITVLGNTAVMKDEVAVVPHLNLV
jgi:RNase P/RNase MRP subunit p29